MQMGRLETMATTLNRRYAAQEAAKAARANANAETKGSVHGSRAPSVAGSTVPGALPAPIGNGTNGSTNATKPGAAATQQEQSESAAPSLMGLPMQLPTVPDLTSNLSLPFWKS